MEYRHATLVSVDAICMHVSGLVYMCAHICAYVHECAHVCCVCMHVCICLCGLVYM